MCCACFVFLLSDTLGDGEHLKMCHTNVSHWIRLNDIKTVMSHLVFQLGLTWWTQHFTFFYFEWDWSLAEALLVPYLRRSCNKGKGSAKHSLIRRRIRCRPGENRVCWTMMADHLDLARSCKPCCKEKRSWSVLKCKMYWNLACSCFAY